MLNIIANITGVQILNKEWYAVSHESDMTDSAERSTAYILKTGCVKNNGTFIFACYCMVTCMVTHSIYIPRDPIMNVTKLRDKHRIAWMVNVWRILLIDKQIIQIPKILFALKQTWILDKITLPMVQHTYIQWWNNCVRVVCADLGI